MPRRSSKMTRNVELRPGASFHLNRCGDRGGGSAKGGAVALEEVVVAEQLCLESSERLAAAEDEAVESCPASGSRRKGSFLKETWSGCEVLLAGGGR